MARMRDRYPQWAESGLLPVADDGCGNYYVLATDGTVGFVETMKDHDRIDRRVAGDLLSFIADQRPGPRQSTS
jgi:hypothetical protein